MTILTELSVEPTSVTSEDRVRLTLTAKNVGMEIVDPELAHAQLLVDGAPSQLFSLAVGNGRRPDKWYALVPGDSVSMSWSLPVEGLFTEPGEHTLVLSSQGEEADPLTVFVT